MGTSEDFLIMRVQIIHHIHFYGKLTEFWTVVKFLIHPISLVLPMKIVNVVENLRLQSVKTLTIPHHPFSQPFLTSLPRTGHKLLSLKLLTQNPPYQQQHKEEETVTFWAAMDRTTWCPSPGTATGTTTACMMKMDSALWSNSTAGTGSLIQMYQLVCGQNYQEMRTFVPLKMS